MNSFELLNNIDERDWLIRFNPVSQLKLRLFCFPYAGGNANIFRGWASMVPAGVEVLGVQYPGRGANDSSPAIGRCDVMVERLLPILSPWLHTDFVFFGHSNGALISYEVARKLSPDLSHRLRHHFLSARVAAHLSTSRKKISHLSDADFIRELRTIGGTPQQLFDDHRLMELIVARLRPDFALGENYKFLPGKSLRCDITTLHGTNDHLVDKASVMRWAELTTGQAQHVDFSGDHFFLTSRQDEVLQLVRGKLKQITKPKSGTL